MTIQRMLMCNNCGHEWCDVEVRCRSSRDGKHKFVKVDYPWEEEKVELRETYVCKFCGQEEEWNGSSLKCEISKTGRHIFVAVDELIGSSD